VPKDELVEVNLELGFTHAVVGTAQPLLQIPNGSIRKWDHRGRTFAQLRTEGLDASDMLKAEFGETCEAFQTVRVDRGTGRHVLSKKPRYRAGLKVGNHVHPGATGSPTTLLDCHHDEGGSPIPELSTTAEPRLFSANPRIINLHLAAQRLPSRVYHRSAKFVEHHPRRLITGKAELPLNQ
jgi:hypothetical protein